MGWSDWSKDSTGGMTSGKVSRENNTTKTEYMRTEDNAKVGSKDDHSHVVVRVNDNGRTTASGHGIFGGRRK